MIFAIDDATRAERAALVDGLTGRSWTYRQLAEEVARRRDWLAASASSPASAKALVFQLCGNTLGSVAWYLAALEAGHAVALLAENLEAGFRERLLELFQPELVLLGERPGVEYDAAAAEGLWRREGAGDAAPLHPDLALLLSTSGSTGSAKFVRLTRRNVEANAESIRQALGLTEHDRPVAHLPMHYSYGLSVINSHLAAGATTILTTASLISPPFWKAVAEQRVSSFSGVPYTYQMLRRLDLDKLSAQSVMAMTQAGGKLDDRAVEFFHGQMAARGGTFWVMYGQTEATARISILPASMLPEKLGSAGQAIPGGALAVLTDEGVTTSPGVVGELIYTGPNVMMGYGMDRGDLAQGDCLGGVLHTGDYASLDADGYVTIVGRAKRDAKIFGLRINMDDVEALLKVHGPAAVVSGKDKLIAYCEFGGAAELASLHSALAAKLRIHASALDFRKIDKLPTSGSGKIDYAKLETE
jgi:acyl-coenzyme A synthetase/AMP-(fatty) acid ligase